MTNSDYENNRFETRLLRLRYERFVFDCKNNNVPQLIAIAEEHIERAKIKRAYQPEELSREYNELGRLKTALSLAKQRNEMIKKGDKQSADKIQESIVKWSGRIPDGSTTKTKEKKWDKGWRSTLRLSVFIVLFILSCLCMGALIYMYAEVVLLLICIIPGAIAFLGGALKNGAKV